MKDNVQGHQDLTLYISERSGVRAYTCTLLLNINRFRSKDIMIIYNINNLSMQGSYSMDYHIKHDN